MESSHDHLLTELEALCCELSAGTLSVEQSARLQQLLLGQPELQDAYCRLVTMDTLLHAEFGEHGQAYASLVAEGRGATNALAAEGTAMLAQRRAVALPSRRRRWALAAIAASILAMFALVSTQSARYWLAKAPPKPALPVADGDHEGEYVMVRSARAIEMLHRVTNAAWKGAAGPFRTPLDEELEEEITDRLFQGAAVLNPFNGQAAGGFVAVLPPGAVLELSVFSDSIGENALAVLELDARGQPTGQLVSFSNQTVARTAENSTLYGQLGTWSERNDTKVEKYFLLAGMQRLDKPETAPDWFVADFSVLVDQPELLHIGWDDSGWAAGRQGKIRRDKDFNDLAATIRIRHAVSDYGHARAQVRTSPELDQETPIALEHAALESGDLESGYLFTLEPRKGVIMTVSSDARLPNALAIVERKTGRIWWQRSKKTADQPQLGAYVIENHSVEPLTFALVGRHQTADMLGTDRWERSEHRVLVNGDRCQTIGFEDLGLDQDWDDLRVNMHWISD